MILIASMIPICISDLSYTDCDNEFGVNGSLQRDPIFFVFWCLLFVDHIADNFPRVLTKSVRVLQTPVFKATQHPSNSLALA